MHDEEQQRCKRSSRPQATTEASAATRSSTELWPKLHWSYFRKRPAVKEKVFDTYTCRKAKGVVGKTPHAFNVTTVRCRSEN